MKNKLSIEYLFWQHRVWRIKTYLRKLRSEKGLIIKKPPSDSEIKTVNAWTKDGKWKVENMQLEITHRCNLSCSKCNRHSNMNWLPYFKDSDMTIKQVEKFISEVKQKNIHISRLRLLGGEPTIHPHADDFISLLFYELILEGNLKRIEIVTNTVVNREERFSIIMNDPNIKRAFDTKLIKFNTSPPDVKSDFQWVLAAPVDLGFQWNICRRPQACGSNLNAYGYWPGGACGAIARLFNRYDYVRQSFPINFGDTWPNIKNDLCKYCGVGCKELHAMKTGEISPSYKRAIEKWEKHEGGCDWKKF